MARSAKYINAPAQEGSSLKQLAQQAAVNILERFQLGDVDVFVDFVNRSIRRTEFENLRTNLRDEAAIAGAACSGKLRFDDRSLRGRLLTLRTSAPGAVRKGRPPTTHSSVYSSPCRSRTPVRRC